MDKIDLNKLAKALGMLGSSHDGEALNAARAVDRMIRAAGATWQEVLRRDEPQPEEDFWRPQEPPPRPPPPEPEDNHRLAAQMLMQWHEQGVLFLYEREPDFLDTVSHWYSDLTPAQQSWFDKIVMRARRRGLPI